MFAPLIILTSFSHFFLYFIECVSPQSSDADNKQAELYENSHILRHIIERSSFAASTFQLSRFSAFIDADDIMIRGHRLSKAD